ncbi:response regulator transcription factor [Paracoccus sp. SCSIO 75233]|uniref:response regulator transcription factor n=1 Tax=Paracoccus sp. SCSIO 75233 TaxID=3017782 RepID=UPI0022F04642|nr:response regulator [Paracoccus sp. SCSIO 75233]WBU51990.1 response regulator [Paracoccus sp. SCSIO 75233]
MARILVIEDEDNIAAALDFLLTRDGHEHERLATGGGAIAAMRAKLPDLVLLDVMLPEISGYQIVQEMRADPVLKDVLVLMMTARGSVTERRKGLALGADGFISKPFEMAELRAEMARMLDGASC